jgi:hypothetical protein
MGPRVGMMVAGCLLVALGFPAPLTAQQPAQRILPRVVPPSGSPRAQAPCLPVFDEALKLYVRPCQTFHTSGPAADWLDRMVVAVTWRKGAQWLNDLAPDERHHIAPNQRGLPRTLPTVSDGRRGELSAAMDGFVAAWLAHESVQRRAAGPRPHGDETSQLPLTGVAKSEHLAPERCPVRWMSSSTDVPLTAPLVLSLEAREGESIRIAASHLVPEAGYLQPDPVLWLIQVTHPGDPEAGRVLTATNPLPGTLPFLEARAPATGSYRVVVAPYRPEFAGRVTLDATVDGLLQGRVEEAFFGGTLLRLSEVAPGDHLFAGALSGGTGHDAVLTLLTEPDLRESRPYLSANNTIGTLPALTLPLGIEEPWLLVSAFDPDHGPELALNLSRIGPRDRADLDRDGDGLSAELEAIVGTCDSLDDASEGHCRPPLSRPAGWEPSDTDHDGFSDLEELFGIRRCYATRATPPRFSLPGCLADDRGNCLRDCPPGTGFIAQLPLSALDGPSPTTHDIYVELDYWTEAATEGGLTESQVALVKRTFEQQVRYAPEAPAGRFVPTDYPVAFHLFQDEPLVMPGFAEVSRLPALAARSLFFNLFFTADRKYTNTFHYVVGTNKGGGQSDVTGRAAIVGLSGGTKASLKFAHEVGHLLGLLHNFKSGNPDHTPFHRSIMSYGYVHSVPPLVEWDGTFVPCGPSSPCPDYFRCSAFPGHGSLCAPDCGAALAPDGSTTHFGHFASEGLPLPPDSSEAGFVPEEGYPLDFLPYLYCYNDGGSGNGPKERFARFASPRCADSRCVQCIGTVCRIDFDRDGDFDGLRGYDLDRDGALNEQPLAGGDDFSLLMARGPRGLRVLSKATLAAFYTGFGASDASNFLPFPAVTYEQHGGFVTDLTNRCDEVARWSHCRDEAHGEAALFRGPVAGDRGLEVQLPDDYCLAPENGLTFSVRVKPFQAPEQDLPVVLAQVGEISLLLEGTADALQWVAVVPGQEEPLRLLLEDRSGLGRWTRVTLALDGKSGTASLSIRRQTLFRMAEQSGLASLANVCGMTIGAAPGQNTAFLGLMDDPMLLLGYVKTLR